MNATAGITGFAPSQVSAGSLGSTDLSPYLNPFTQDVIDTTGADIDRSTGIAQEQAKGNAAAVGAFGGDRQGIEQAEIAGQGIRAKANVGAQLRAQNFGQAQAAATGDISRALTADTQNQMAGIQGAGLNLSAAGQLFGQGDTASERIALMREDASILDLVSRDAADLKRSLGARDQALVSDYMETVREIERRVQQLSSRDTSKLALPDAPSGIPANFDEHVKLQFDLMALAFQANLTRVASFMMAAEVSNQPYNFMGIADAFHPLSHHANNPQKVEKLARLQAWNTQAFARFVKKMSEMPDGEGTMLDNSIILFGSNMSDSNMHNHFPLPTAVLGKGAGALRGNTHLRVPDRTPLANLHVTLLSRAGVPVDKLGDSSGTFEGI